MVDPVPLVAQLLSEIPPLVSFLSELPDESLPTRGTGKGLQAPDSAPWRTAADGVLRELRLFLSLPVSPSSTTTAPAPPPVSLELCGGPQPLVASAPKASELEARTDIYLEFGEEALGVKFRDVDEHGSTHLLEVKVRGTVKKRGAEEWKKVCSAPLRGASVLEAVRRAVPEVSVAADGSQWVRLKKQRWQQDMRGAVVEQTELEVAVGGEGREWQTLPRRYRTICFEGKKPDRCYELLGNWLGLPEDWEMHDLEGALAALAAGVAQDGPGFVAPCLCGYPRFVSAVLASLEPLCPDLDAAPSPGPPPPTSEAAAASDAGRCDIA
eukprot:CAMPEP_0204126602 /NCGR_PEP_ID=MMETSP0361-20130328/11096_1 /ASSEMBLY_ACC=CAM_ASM_000343 /TAXON_ID=268821 /ORGANISM="Scrippsiella Hangoei, Strain SHTV-5" /LENGTH=324 /DNA_ID=CAMNT_0051078497 /DNA_START=48 /DNA_END=1022 /DNA_ORIENTATION=-